MDEKMNDTNVSLDKDELIKAITNKVMLEIIMTIMPINDNSFISKQDIRELLDIFIKHNIPLPVACDITTDIMELLTKINQRIGDNTNERTN